jgi:hypothetical protein
MKKVKTLFYNNREVIIIHQSEEIDYVLVYFKDDKNKSKFKVTLTELTNEKTIQ